MWVKRVNGDDGNDDTTMTRSSGPKVKAKGMGTKWKAKARAPARKIWTATEARYHLDDLSSGQHPVDTVGEGDHTK